MQPCERVKHATCCEYRHPFECRNIRSATPKSLQWVVCISLPSGSFAFPDYEYSTIYHLCRSIKLRGKVADTNKSILHIAALFVEFGTHSRCRLDHYEATAGQVQVAPGTITAAYLKHDEIYDMQSKAKTGDDGGGKSLQY